jgi:hypothetical protein
MRQILAKLLTNHPREALRTVKAVVVPDDDYLTLVAAEETIAAAEAKRKTELDKVHSTLKGGARFTYPQILYLRPFLQLYRKLLKQPAFQQHGLHLFPLPKHTHRL